MNILDEIVAQQREDLKSLRSRFSRSDFEQFEAYTIEGKSLRDAIKSSAYGIIAEIKRSSPSAGSIRPDLCVSEIAKAYDLALAAAISVLTNTPYFGGTMADLQTVKNSVSIPVLRKDFIVDELQLFQAKAYGADAILLIAESLSREEMIDLTQTAHEIGLEVVAECHSHETMLKIPLEVDVIGVNNRDLKRQVTDLTISEGLINYLPDSLVKITESGIRNANDLARLKDLGYQGALIGEHFMKADDPGEELHKFHTELNTHAD